MKKILLISLAIFGALQLNTVNTSADYGVNCQTQYGVSNCPTTTSIVVNKMVQDPATKQYVDNLGASDSKYSASSVVPFRIVVTNTGNVTTNKLTLTDTIPSYTSINGKGSSNPLYFTIDSLSPNESKTFDFTIQVVSDDQLPIDQNLICVTNKVDANTTNAAAHDESSFCISHNLPTTKGGIPVYPTTPTKTTPKTGPEMLAIIGLIPSGIAGIIMRRKNKLT